MKHSKHLQIYYIMKLCKMIEDKKRVSGRERERKPGMEFILITQGLRDKKIRQKLNNKEK